MLGRLLKGRGTIVPIALVSFLGSTVGLPVVAGAQTRGNRSPVLLVPLQRGPGVPEMVQAKSQEMLAALLGIEPGLKLTIAPVEAVSEPGAPAPAAEPVEADAPVLAPLPVHPDIEKAQKLATTGRGDAIAGRHERALTRLMQAKGLFQKRMSHLDAFDDYVEVLAWIAAAFVNGGFSEEAGPAISELLTVRPDYVAVADLLGGRAAGAIESAKARIKTGAPVTVTAEPPDADVWIDGKLVGKGTVTVSDLPRGNHFVRVASPITVPTARRIDNRNRDVTVRLAAKVRAGAAPVTAVTVAPASAAGERTLAWYARNGEFLDPGFTSLARDEARRNLADFVVLGYVGRAATAYHLGLFLFDARSGRIAALDPATIDTELANLQVALLDQESRLARAVGEFPEDRMVRSRPDLYARTAAPAPRPAPAPAPAPAPKATVAPAPAPQPVVAAAPASAAAPEPVPVMMPTRQAAPSGGFDEMPEDFPWEVIDKPVEKKKPLYKQWWLWTAVGAVVAAGAIAAGVLLSKDEGGPANVKGQATWR